MQKAVYGRDIWSHRCHRGAMWMLEKHNFKFNQKPKHLIMTRACSFYSRAKLIAIRYLERFRYINNTFLWRQKYPKFHYIGLKWQKPFCKTSANPDVTRKRNKTYLSLRRHWLHGCGSLDFLSSQKHLTSFWPSADMSNGKCGSWC